MIKFGKLIENETIPIRLVSFDLLLMCWEEDTETINFKVEKEEFAAGAYRKCFKAYTSCSKLIAKTFVIKKHNDAARANFKLYQDAGKKCYTEEERAKKTVQMHTLAKNIADKLGEKVSFETYRQHFVYSPLYFGKLVDGTIATIEQYLEGQFNKYVNNSGDICNQGEFEEERVMQEKAEALIHFSYENSQKQLMLLDIQGFGYNLIDPEIATVNVDNTVNGEREFLAGNMSLDGIETFLSQHSCSKFCELVSLEKN